MLSFTQSLIKATVKGRNTKLIIIINCINIDQINLNYDFGCKIKNQMGLT